MLLGFKRRFAPFVQDGTKTHTIRAKRKIQPKVGEMCHCYVDIRQKSMRLLGRWPCTKIQGIIIAGGGHADDTYIMIDGVPLYEDERNSLAWLDGFRSQGMNGAFAEMLEFWRETHTHDAGRDRRRPLYFEGDVIHWDYRHPAGGRSRQR